MQSSIVNDLEHNIANLAFGCFFFCHSVVAEWTAGTCMAFSYIHNRHPVFKRNETNHRKNKTTKDNFIYGFRSDTLDLYPNHLNSVHKPDKKRYTIFTIQFVIMGSKVIYPIVQKDFYRFCACKSHTAFRNHRIFGNNVGISHFFCPVRPTLTD